MNLCSNHHQEVCYEGRTCPVCEIITEKDEKIEDLQKEIRELNQQISDMES